MKSNSGNWRYFRGYFGKSRGWGLKIGKIQRKIFGNLIQVSKLMSKKTLVLIESLKKNVREALAA